MCSQVKKLETNQGFVNSTDAQRFYIRYKNKRWMLTAHVIKG